MNAQPVIVYDKECPLCQWYTGEFLRFGILKEGCRMPFDALDHNPGLVDRLDMNRARHEIPLVLPSGEVKYGVEALMYLIGTKIPGIGRLGYSRVFTALINPLYGLISYNRRLIAGSKKGQAGSYDPEPDFHWGYRLAYLFVSIAAILVISWGLARGWEVPMASMGVDVGRMVLMATMTLGWPMTLAAGLFTRKVTVMDWVGQVVTVMLIGVLIQAPSLFFLGEAHGIWIGSVCTLLSFGTMVYDYRRRVAAMGFHGFWHLVLPANLVLAAAIFFVLYF